MLKIYFVYADGMCEQSHKPYDKQMKITAYFLRKNNWKELTEHRRVKLHIQV